MARRGWNLHRRARLKRRRAVILTVTTLFAAIVAGLLAYSGSLATTGLIVLLWLAAGLGVGFLMAKSR